MPRRDDREGAEASRLLQNLSERDRVSYDAVMAVLRGLAGIDLERAQEAAIQIRMDLGELAGRWKDWRKCSVRVLFWGTAR